MSQAALLLLLLLLLPFLPLLLASENAAPRQQFLIVIDAGSTGSRLNLFAFERDQTHSTGLRLLHLNEKKISPGLSAYANFPERVRPSIRNLMAYAQPKVPPNLHKNTTVIVRATAGLRLLPPAARRRVSAAVEKELRLSTFRVPPSAAVRVISGTEEAEYGWVAVNFLLDAFDKEEDSKTFGMLDMGGGSTQITFVSDDFSKIDPNRVRFRTVRGKVYTLHQHSYLGLGLSAATLQMLGHRGNATASPFVSPCLHPQLSSNFSFGSTSITVKGDASIRNEDRAKLCAAAALQTVRRHELHSPPGLGSAHFVAVSSFYYIAKTLHSAFPDWAISVPANLTVGYFANAAARVCANPPSSGKYKSLLCFSLNHVVALLHDGYGFDLDKRLLVTHQIKGTSASWPLGLAIHYLTCHDIGTTCLKPQSSSSISVNLISAAQLVSLLLLAAIA